MLELWKRNRRYLRWLRRQRQGWLGIVFKALRQTFTLDSSLAAAAISYFALFSFFPLLLLITFIATSWLDPILDRSEIFYQLDFVAPALGYLLQQHLERIVGIDQALTGASVVSLIWSSSSIFYVLRRTLDRIWEVGPVGALWRHRWTALLTVLTISLVLLTASIAYSTVVSVLQVLTPAGLQRLSGIVSQTVNLAISTLLFAFLYRFLPHFHVDWSDVWPGAIAAGLLWEIVKRLFFFYATIYLAQPNLTELIYGSVATIIAFLGWSYISSFIFIFGAYINVGYCRRRERLAMAAQT